MDLKSIPGLGVKAPSGIYSESCAGTDFPSSFQPFCLEGVSSNCHERETDFSVVTDICY